MDALAALAAIRREMDREHVEAPAPGFLVTHDWAAAWCVNRPSAGRLIREGIRTGIMEMEEFRVRAGGVVRRVPHYRAVAK